MNLEVDYILFLSDLQRSLLSLVSGDKEEFIPLSRSLLSLVLTYCNDSPSILPRHIASILPRYNFSLIVNDDPSTSVGHYIIAAPLVVSLVLTHCIAALHLATHISRSDVASVPNNSQIIDNMIAIIIVRCCQYSVAPIKTVLNL